jgi:hypothetical protein
MGNRRSVVAVAVRGELGGRNVELATRRPLSDGVVDQPPNVDESALSPFAEGRTGGGGGGTGTPSTPARDHDEVSGRSGGPDDGGGGGGVGRDMLIHADY